MTSVPPLVLTVVEVGVVVDFDGSDRLGLVLPVAVLVAKTLVAGCAGGDRGGLAVREQPLGAGVELLPARRTAPGCRRRPSLRRLPGRSPQDQHSEVIPITRARSIRSR